MSDEFSLAGGRWPELLVWFDVVPDSVLVWFNVVPGYVQEREDASFGTEKAERSGFDLNQAIPPTIQADLV